MTHSYDYSGEIAWTDEQIAFCRDELDPALHLGRLAAKHLRALADELHIDDGLDDFLNDAVDTILKCTDHPSLRDWHSRDVFEVAVRKDAAAVDRSVEYWISQMCGSTDDE